MRRLLPLVLVIVCAGVTASRAQFKAGAVDEPRISETMMQEHSSSFLFGWFNPDNFRMRHSVEMSYQTTGQYGMSLATYTNSMTYQFSENLNARADVSFSYSPFNSVPGMGNDLSRIYLSRAEVNYRPWQNMSIHVMFRQIPYGTYGMYGMSPWYNSWYHPSTFDGGF
jgi:hypothetical protein